MKLLRLLPLVGVVLLGAVVVGSTDENAVVDGVDIDGVGFTDGFTDVDLVGGDVVFFIPVVRDGVDVILVEDAIATKHRIRMIDFIFYLLFL